MNPPSQAQIFKTNSTSEEKPKYKVSETIRADIQKVYQETIEAELSKSKTYIDGILNGRDQEISDIFAENIDINWKHSHDFKNNKDADADQKKAMLHALLFFKEAKNTKGANLNLNDLIIKSNHGDKNHKNIQQSLKNISLWINKAIAFMYHEPRCKSIRKVYISNKRELDYYQSGKVFRMKNIISAYKVDDPE